MSNILATYTKQPKFPATDQHPNAIRYQVGQYWVDAIGGQPTQAEVDAVVQPPDDPRLAGLKTDQSVVDLATRIKAMTAAEIDAWFAANVTTVAQARTAMATITKLLATKL